MKTKSHGKRISTVALTARIVEQFRTDSSITRISMGPVFFDGYSQAGGFSATGIRLESDKADVHEWARINSQRFYRWLDDLTKDNNLLPSNMLPSVLMSVSMPYRIEWADEFLRPLGLACHQLATEVKPIDVCGLQNLIKEASEAQQSILSLLDGATRNELQAALREVTELQAVVDQLRNSIESQINP